MAMADEMSERVCPRCGTPAEMSEYCGDCGLHLGALPELPSKAEWLARGAQATAVQEDSTRVHSPTVSPTPQPHAGLAQPPASGVHRAASIAPLLHPTEPSRLALALIAAALALLFPFLILIHTGGIGGILVLLAGVVGSFWVAIQLSRARLLGRSVRVDASTFPEVQAIVAEVCATLDYHRKLEVYITDKVTTGIVSTSLLGTRLIVIEGGLVADLLQPAKRPQLTFLVGRSIGALRARHARLEVLIRVLEAAEVLKYVAPFIRPYYRATAYSGDQIGMMCCSDLEAALEATRRLLVGSELASQMTSGAAVPQALIVKRRILPRLVQLLAVEPHVTNRYANLLCFGRYHAPEMWAAMSASMDEHEQRCLDGIWQRSPYRLRVAGL
jgi:hypothetical protein